MQVHVKTPRIELHIKGDLYPPLMELLKKDFGPGAISIQDETENEIDDESVSVDDLPLYREISVSPGETMAIHRKNMKLTQKELGERLGGKSRQFVSDLEKGRRPILAETAKKLSVILGHNYKRYL